MADESSASLVAPQPPPRPGAAYPAWPLVIAEAEAMLAGEPRPALALMVADMRCRHEEGCRKYGMPLAHDNGRDHLIDLYQELLDGCAYARCAADAAPAAARPEARVLLRDLIRLAERARELIARRGD